MRFYGLYLQYVALHAFTRVPRTTSMQRCDPTSAARGSRRKNFLDTRPISHRTIRIAPKCANNSRRERGVGSPSPAICITEATHSFGSNSTIANLFHPLIALLSDVTFSTGGRHHRAQRKTRVVAGAGCIWDEALPIGFTWGPYRAPSDPLMAEELQWSSSSSSSAYSSGPSSSFICSGSSASSTKIQPSPYASSLIVSGLSDSAELTSTTVPVTGA